MKIWYQSASSFGFEPVWDVYGKTLEEKCRSIVGPDDTVHVAGIPVMVRDIENWKHVQYFQNVQILRNMRLAQEQGFDAFVIGCTLDVGLQEGRSMLDMPVIGINEASYHVAMMLGRKYTFVTSSMAFIQVYEELIERYGVGARYLASRYIAPATEEEIALALEQPQAMVDKFAMVARQAIADGASVIIPAPAFYSALMHRAGITQIDGAIVLDTIAVAIQTAQMMIGLQRLGMSVARLSGVYAKPDQSSEQQMLTRLIREFHI
jgi:allantoin racemase